MKNILIIGKPRVGKSTLIESMIKEFREKMGGFVTREIRKNNERHGFEIATLDGLTAVLADKDFVSAVRVGKYGVNVDNLEKIAVPAIEKSLKQKEIVVIDEVANMEIASIKFRKIVLRAFLSNRIVLATVHIHDDPFTNALKARSDVQIFELTVRNRDQVKQGVINAVKSMLLLQ